MKYIEIAKDRWVRKDDILIFNIHRLIIDAEECEKVKYSISFTIRTFNFPTEIKYKNLEEVDNIVSELISE